MRSSSWRLKGFLFVIGTILVFIGALPSSGEERLLVSRFIKGELPVHDPNSPLWKESKPYPVLLSAQVVSKPRIYKTAARKVTVRSLNNGGEIAFLIEWEDPSNSAGVLRHQEYRDAIALQFPVDPRKTPYFAMGEKDRMVNIWQWKADWETDLLGFKDIEERYPGMASDSYPFSQAKPGQVLPAPQHDRTFLTAWGSGNPLSTPNRPSPVEDLNAGGFGSLTSQPDKQQNVAGRGVWSGGKWKVVMARKMASPDSGDVQFKAGAVIPIAFAVWDGANGERGGEKAVSGWHYLGIETPKKMAFRPVPKPVTFPRPPVPAAYKGMKNPLPLTLENIEEGRKLYDNNCSFCHGGNLDGKGPEADAFLPSPAAFTDKKSIAGGKLSEDFVFWRIKEGGRALPEKHTPWHSAMPAWKEELTDEEIWKIVMYLYEFVGVPKR